MKKKVLVIVCSIIIVISILIVLVLVNQQKTNSNESVYDDGDNLGYDYSEENNENNYNDYYEEETTQAIKLSDSCEKILATGTNKNGDFYELVANQEETYDKVKIEIGVIKNNKWLLEPTSDMPFIDKKTGLLNVEDVNSNNIGIEDVRIEDFGIDFVYGTFKYVADGCFCIYQGITKNIKAGSTCLIIYNAENKKTYYNTYNNSKYSSSNIYTEFYKDAAYGNKLLIERGYKRKSDFFILDTNTMETKMIVEGTEYNIMGPACDGLFAVGDFDSNYGYNRDAIMYFYDLKGNKIIDLTSYNNGDVYSVDHKYFVDGKYAFFVKNSAGTEFQVTIDTKGNVINSIENSKQN